MIYNIIQSSILHLVNRHMQRMVDSLTVHGAKLWEEEVVGDSSYLFPVSVFLRSKSQLYMGVCCTLK